MKYLKTYKLFETIGYSELTDDMWNDISDILLELQDDGFNISKDISDVKKIGNKICEDVIEIIIDQTYNDNGIKKSKNIDFKSIESVVRRLIDFMSQYKWNYSLMYFGDMIDWVEFEDNPVWPPISNVRSKTAFKVVFYQSVDHVIGESYSNIDDVEDDVRDILLELEDTGLFQVEIDRTRKDKQSSSVKGYTEIFLEVRIMRPWNSPKRVIPGAPEPPGGTYPGDIFLWKEIKDVIVRLNQWYYEYSGNEFTPGISGKTAQELAKIGIKYDTNSPFRMFNGGIEFGIGWYKPEDFDNLGDFISFTSLRIEMKL